MSELEKAVAAAALELQEKAAEGKPPAPVEALLEETEETPAEETASEPADETPETDGLSEDEQKESQNLYRLLKDPKTAKSVVAALAAQQGLLQSDSGKPLTKPEERAARKEIKEILSDALGKDYQFLADKLSTAFEGVLEQERADSSARFAEIQRGNVEREVVANYEKLAKDTKGESKKYEARMAQLAEEIPIGSQDVRTYIERLYTVAAGERKTSPQKVADQIRRNAGDASARLRTGAQAPTQNSIPDKKMSLNESVAWATEQLKQGKK